MASDAKRGADLWRKGINRISSLATYVYRQDICKDYFFGKLYIIMGPVTSSPILSASPDNHTNPSAPAAQIEKKFQEPCPVLPKLPGSLETKYTREAKERQMPGHGSPTAEGHLRGTQSAVGSLTGQILTHSSTSPSMIRLCHLKSLTNDLNRQLICARHCSVPGPTCPWGQKVNPA